MTPRVRVALALLGLALVALSLAALAYWLWPVQTLRQQVPVPPTLFAPPQSWALMLGWI
ncbi:MAG: hypothetical protein HY872_04265 [Chloroflexi bacterium]|nr:hypothetical protein [Chloroflexota bacterium]